MRLNRESYQVVNDNSNQVRHGEFNQVRQGEFNHARHVESNNVVIEDQSRTSNANDGASIGYLTQKWSGSYHGMLVSIAAVVDFLGLYM